MTEDRTPDDGTGLDPTTGLPRSSYDWRSDPNGPELVRRVDRALARLLPRTRNIFLLSRLDGKTYAEIAALYGMREERVRVIVKNAMWAIRYEMDHGRPLPWRERLRDWWAGLRGPPV